MQTTERVSSARRPTRRSNASESLDISRHTNGHRSITSGLVPDVFGSRSVIYPGLTLDRFLMVGISFVARRWAACFRQHAVDESLVDRSRWL